MRRVDEALEVQLAELRPVIRWADVARDGIEVWRRADDDWDMADPPEDHALPPMLDWNDTLRALVLAEYQQRFGKFLEDGQSYEISWPPEASLWTPGTWYREHAPQGGCQSTEFHEPSEDCDGNSDRVVIDSMARWDWRVTVETWERRVRPDGREGSDLVEEDSWEFGSTEMDPRDVEYGPHRLNPDRTMLFMQTAR